MIKSYIKKITPYKPPLEGRALRDYLLFDFNERTTEPIKKVKDALKKFVDSGRLQVYPEYGDLEAKIAKYAKVKKSQVMAVNGADQGIDIISRAYLGEGDRVIIPFPGFPMYYLSADIQGARILNVPYGEDKFPLKEILEFISRVERIKLIVFSNPNNPTGVWLSIKNLKKILDEAQRKDIAILHDEAYFEFSKITAKSLIQRYDNLLVVRTFSKPFGLAGLRIGYVISQEKNIKELLKIRGPYDVNMFAKTAVLAALDDVKYMEDYAEEVMERSKPRLEEFFRKRGIKFLPSRANFLLLRIENPERITKILKDEGILVRPKELPDKTLGIRVSIGTLQDTRRFIRAMDKVLQKIFK